MDFEEFMNSDGYPDFDDCLDIAREEARIPKALLKHAVSFEIGKYIDSLQLEELLPQIDAEMLKLLSEIVHALDDDSLDDPTCFQQIGAIIKAFKERGIYLDRHDWQV